MIKKLLIVGMVSVAMVGIPLTHLFAENLRILDISTAVTLSNTQVPRTVIGDFTKPNKLSLVNKQLLPAVGKPTRFIIPKLNINTDVEHIGLTPGGAVGVPQSARTVSWFSVGPRPGQAGSAVISGHSGIWKNGSHSIFDALPSLRIGDKIFITDDKGVQRTFKVVDTKIYGKDQVVPEIFATSTTSNVNIITCHGQWLPNQKTYSQRFVVFTQLVA
jgi:hypothetical protein